jgi:hypothetical protein
MVHMPTADEIAALRQALADALRQNHSLASELRVAVALSRAWAAAAAAMSGADSTLQSRALIRSLNWPTPMITGVEGGRFMMLKMRDSGAAPAASSKTTNIATAGGAQHDVAPRR